MFFKRTLSAVFSLALLTPLPSHSDPLSAASDDKEIELREGELKSHEKSLEDAKATLNKINTDGKGYQSFLAGQIDPGLRKKLLDSTRSELTGAQSRKADLNARIKYYNAQIGNNNANAKIWTQELRDYKEELPILEVKVRQLQKADEWLKSGRRKPPREVLESSMVQKMFRRVKEAEMNVKSEEDKISDLKKQLSTLKRDNAPVDPN